VSGKDVDLQARLHFPNTAIFVEKPISWTDDFKDVHSVADQMQGATVSVGYMLRYLRAVQEMKRILKENKLNVMATMTTYFMA
jgi:predicted dehydrogenase